MTMRNLAQSMKIVGQQVPKDINGAAAGGDLVSLRNYQGCGLFLQVGAHTGDAVAVTFKQAKNVNGNSEKAMTAHTRGYKNVPGTDDKWAEFTITAGTFNIAANTNYFVPIKPGILDVSNRFDCLEANVAAGSASTIIAAALILWGGPEGISGNAVHIPSAIVDMASNS